MLLLERNFKISHISKIRIVAMFINFYSGKVYITIIFARIYTMHLPTKFRIPNSNRSLALAIK
jgi:uncharacterized membrane protein YdcZ (DUF606 family)